MPCIKGFELFAVRRAASSRIATSYGDADAEREHVVVRLTSDTGVSGWGEASPLKEFTGESPEIVRVALEQELLPLVVGLEVGDIGVAHARMEAALPGNAAAKAAVDMAMYDLLGNATGRPVHQLLGGAHRQSVPITRPIGIETPQRAVELARQYTQAGHRTLKLKVGVDPRGDVERVLAVRAAVGPDVNLRIDANQGYDLPSAMRVLQALRGANLEYCEQPVPAGDLRALATLRAHTGVRIAADESLHTLADAMRIVDAQAADVFVIKLIKTGGLWNALRIAAVGATAGVRCVAVSPFDLQIGAAHALHLAAALPELAGACELTVFASQKEMASTVHEVREGELHVGRAPGCGVSSIAELPGVTVRA